MNEKPLLRCAIYTRKSTEEGLDMEYNTLDAQREAGEKYIEAMKGEGWRIIPEPYNDGGFSGGNMDRPGLNKLIGDIQAGRIDIVVVYKVDRLSRSLTDFAKLMEVFDAHRTCFVSVTQHFNTKDSMGRLTLNILLSFAQFEREMIGERVRDKFAASKKKGMWMGGWPPLGYDIVDRKLTVNPQEEKLVKHIFNRFIDLGSVSLLMAELNAEGYRTKAWVSATKNQVGGRSFSINTLISHLKNRVYLGDVHHKGQHYPGQHQALITPAIFDKAHSLFKESAKVKRKRTWCAKSPALLKGILVCEGCGGVLSPTYTCKGNKQYHYYVANSYRKNTCPSCAATRLPAGEVEAVVSGQLKAVFASPHLLIEIWRKVRVHQEGFREADLHDALRQIGSLWDTLFPPEQKRITHLLIDRVVVKSQGLDIAYRASGLERVMTDLQQVLSNTLHAGGVPQ